MRHQGGRRQNLQVMGPLGGLFGDHAVIVRRSVGDRSGIVWDVFLVFCFVVLLIFGFSCFLIFLFSRFITFSFSRSRSRFRSHHFRFHFLVPASDERLGSMSTCVKYAIESKALLIKY